MSDNKKLWNAVVATDPNYTKQFSRGGGFKGTAVNFVYLARKATEQFGPIGIGWGHEVINETYAQGARIGDGGHEIVHVLHIKFWYVLDGTRGEFESFGQTTFVGTNRNGTFTDEEAPKKSLTDALSKAMSWLGFGADIHLGLYDDNKYVASRKAEFGNGKQAEAAEPEQPRVDVDAAKLQIATAGTGEGWEKVKDGLFKQCTSLADAEAWEALKPLLAARAKEIGYAPPKKAAKKTEAANGAATH